MRLGGLLLVAAGAALAYFFIYTPYIEAASGAGKISMSLKGSILAPMALVLGLGLVIGGEKFSSAMNNSPEKAKRYGKTSLTGWLVLGTAMLSGFGIFYWLKKALQCFGYY